MRKLVVDVNVALKWFVPEIHSEAAARLLDSQFYLFAPDLIGPEFGNVLWKKTRRGEITPEEASEILRGFEAVGIEIYPSSLLLASAMDLAFRLDRSVYDSLYLALAIAQDCPLITGDRKFHSVVAASPLASHICWIEEFP